MRQEYKKPTVEIISFDNSDIICASGDIPTPVKDTLNTNGGVELKASFNQLIGEVPAE